jgi:hypothetical protein
MLPSSARIVEIGPLKPVRHSQSDVAGSAGVGLPAAPATVAAYLAHLADSGLKASTIGRKLAAIAYAHRLKGLDTPTASEAVHAVAASARGGLPRVGGGRDVELFLAKQPHA